MKPNRFDHDDALRICRQFADQLTDSESVALNIVAGAYASNDHVSAEQLRLARAIVRKYDAPAGSPPAGGLPDNRVSPQEGCPDDSATNDD